MLNVLWILLALILVLLNGFFVAAEFGMVKLRHTRIQAIKATYGRRGKILASVHKNLDAYLSACQLGITLASLGLGWIGEPAFASLLEPVFKLIGIHSVEVTEFISFFTAFFIISFLHIVVGELMPKSLAIRQSEKVSVWTAIPLYIFYWVMLPAIWLLNTCANFLLRVVGLDAKHNSENFHSTEEIKLILHASHLHGELTKDEAEIIEHTLEFAELRVTEVMRPYSEMTALDIRADTQSLLQKVMVSRFSRYPIYDNEAGDIIGIVHVKDLFSALYQQQNIAQLKSLIRPVLKVSARLPALELLHKFREGMPHFALIYNAHTLVGFVTLDNLLHVLIGRIKDEFHKTKDDWIVNTDGSLTVKGECSIYSLEQALEEILAHDVDIHSEPDVDTVAEVILQRSKGVLKQGQRFDFEEFSGEIESLQGQKISQIKVWPKKRIEGFQI